MKVEFIEYQMGRPYSGRPYSFYLFKVNGNKIRVPTDHDFTMESLEEAAKAVRTHYLERLYGNQPAVEGEVK